MRYLRILAKAPLALRLALMNFLFNLGVETANVFMPLYAQGLGASHLEVGLIATAWGVAYFISSLVFGRQSDIHGRLIFIRYGLGLAVIANVSQMIVTTPTLLLASRAFVGFSLGTTTAATMAYTYEHQKQIGRFASYGSLGFLGGALVSTVVVNFHFLFLVSALSAFAAFLISLTFTEDPCDWVKVVKAVVPLVKANRRLYSVFFFRQLGGFAIWAVFPLFLAAIGASRPWIATYDAINMGTQFIVIRLVEKFNPAKAVRAGLLLNGLTFVLYGVSNNYLQIIPTQVLLGIGWSCLFIGSLSYLMRKNAERGTVSGLLYSTIYLSSGFGPLIGGAIAEVWGFSMVMYFAAALTFGSFFFSRGLRIDGEVGHVEATRKPR